MARRIAGEGLFQWIEEKFSTTRRSIGLNGFLADKADKQFLKALMFMPAGDTKAYRILKRLSDEEKNS